MLLQRPIEYGALLLALLATPEVADEVEMSHQLDEIAAQCRAIAKGSSPFALMEAINTTLFASRGFTGNSTDYYNPKNSNLHAVLDRKTGIPITLSIIWAAVAQRLGLRASGCSFPTHFLVRVDLPEADDNHDTHALFGAGPSTDTPATSEPPVDQDVELLSLLERRIGWDPTGLWSANYGQGELGPKVHQLRWLSRIHYSGSIH
jgi:hypothetical protein